MARKKKNKNKPLSQTNTGHRYYDLRLVWFVLALATLFIGIRWLLHHCCGLPFTNVVEYDDKGHLGVGFVSDSQENFEWMLNIVEAFVGLIAMCLLISEPKYKNNTFGSITLMGGLVMFFPSFLMAGNIICWVVIIALMLAFAVYIGRVRGFGLRMGREQVRQMIVNTEDITVHYKHHDIKFPGYSSIWFTVVVLSIFVWLLVHYFNEMRC